MLTYYPPLKPFAEHHLTVETPHVIFVEECGNPEGLPVLFVHGGPGGGCNADHRRFFDPTIYRIILFDQRGCGRSTPHAELQNNNTQALVADMEAIRDYLNIKHWVVFGGSWGSTLSLVYAQTHPQFVLGLILRGIFLSRDEDLAWLFHDGAKRIYPDYWEDFISLIPEAERNALISAYYQRLTGNDEVARMAAAKAWSQFEGRCATLLPRPALIENFTEPFHALSLARIECHYFLHNCFLEDNQILANMRRLHGIPGIIVHGRYDMLCPLDNAWALHQSWPASKLEIVREAGHAASEPAVLNALIQATREMAAHLGK